ncbi:HugZ family protein [Marinospirillum perlucidum]|uniref:HugZ family pyridoxamine 5'-phosphate oxidase n=1 Tax=Marinospirillum perlucidum TaxID=1982602 RepID=UPI000DF140FF|nr:pyridoxamine 5'-phosphate oxidase family protein [Marinospirillum perlucidum]
MQQKSPDTAAIQKEVLAFISQFKSGILATVTPEGQPFSSYAPLIYEQDCFFIFISRLAQHTGNLQASAQASLLFIEAEEQASNIFARQRASIQVTARQLDKATAASQLLLDKMQAQLGSTLEVLRGLDDFCLFELEPLQATWVTCFAKAFTLEGRKLDQIQQKQPD